MKKSAARSLGRFNADARRDRRSASRTKRRGRKKTSAASTTTAISVRPTCLRVIRFTLLFPCQDARNSKCCPPRPATHSSPSKSLRPFHSLSYDAIRALVGKEDCHHVLVNRDPFGTQPVILSPTEVAEIDCL